MIQINARLTSIDVCYMFHRLISLDLITTIIFGEKLLHNTKYVNEIYNYNVYITKYKEDIKQYDTN